MVEQVTKRHVHSIKHGQASHPLYLIWRGMVRRCHAPTDAGFRNYGARKIEVYEPWRDDPRPFIEWIEENLGPRPEGMSLDRIDNDGNYEPGNLRWATAKEQVNNRRRSLFVSEDYYQLLTQPLEFVLTAGK